jgi:ferredoxin-NADP reductase
MRPHPRATGADVDARLLLSARTLDDVLYREEIEDMRATGVATKVTLTRGQAPAEWDGWTRRIDREMLTAVGPEPGPGARSYVCGPTPFVEEAARLLVEIGHDPASVRTERFGPTGG